MRRGVGVGKAIKAKKQKEAFANKGNALAEAKLDDMKSQMETFKAQLEEFAVKHSKKINTDPEFRNKFQRMCAAIGVDPLSSSKGFWAETLGVGTYFYELGVQTLHIGLATRESNGGILYLDELQRYLQKLRNKGPSSKSGSSTSSSDKVTEEDVRRAVELLEPLGNGVKLVQVASRTMMVSVPMELSGDHTAVLAAAQSGDGSVSINSLTSGELGWTIPRAERALDLLQKQGMAWVDDGGTDGGRLFWFPSISLSLVN